MHTVSSHSSAMADKYNESILVVKATTLFPDPTIEGFFEVDFTTFMQRIVNHQEFHPRGLMESDPTYKQIIPYLVFTHQERYFLMQRTAQGFEKRLHDQYTLGIGGHVRQEDLQGTTLFDWAAREFHEEINYTGHLEIEPLGVINDNSNDVGKVHAGLVLLLHGNSEAISIKSELKNGTLLPLEEIMQHNKNLESWSQLVLKYLLERTAQEHTDCCC